MDGSAVMLLLKFCEAVGVEPDAENDMRGSPFPIVTSLRTRKREGLCTPRLEKMRKQTRTVSAMKVEPRLYDQRVVAVIMIHSNYKIGRAHV